jgi:hypothetical protein
MGIPTTVPVVARAMGTRPLPNPVANILINFSDSGHLFLPPEIFQLTKSLAFLTHAVNGFEILSVLLIIGNRRKRQAISRSDRRWDSSTWRFIIFFAVKRLAIWLILPAFCKHYSIDVRNLSSYTPKLKTMPYQTNQR